MDFTVFHDLIVPGTSKIILLVMDGLGGLARPSGGGTELEEAATPNLDRLAARGLCGLLDPIGPGITPGSGPAHFALFGYDPVANLTGRGLLEGAGIGLDLTSRDLVARINFATLDRDGNVVDRRAGRISTAENERLCSKIKKRIDLGGGVEFDIRTVKEHRAMILFRTDGLSELITDTDPQATGVKPLKSEALSPQARASADLVAKFAEQVRVILADEPRANFCLVRGFAKSRSFQPFRERYGLRGLALANYPMYRGVARLLGMELHPVVPDIGAQFEALAKAFTGYDFFFLHVKATDSRGEDGDFDGKVKVIEQVDRLVPRIDGLGHDVFVATGDHSTPAVLKSHSWHPVPVLLHGPACRADAADRFGERACLGGGLGTRPMTDLMPLALAHAGRLKKFGA